jgi:hypothetical protein
MKVFLGALCGENHGGSMSLKLRFCLIFLVLSCIVSAEGADQRRLWIFFKGRPYLHGLSTPPSFSPAAVKRRETRAAVRWDESDYPVDPSYLGEVKAAGAVIRVESRWLNAVSALCDSACRARLRVLPFVQSVQPVAEYHRPIDRIVEDKAGPSSLDQNSPMALNYGAAKAQIFQLKVQIAHNKGYAGQGEIVAIFDSGFRKDHIAFANHPIIAEHDYVFGDDNVQDGGDFDTHGTGTWSCVGGAAPGKLYGPAYKSSFLLAATEDIRSETVVEEDNWVAAFEWADRLGATVISSSLGYRDWYQQSDFNGSTAITSKVASMAAQKGIVVANSAGNEGPLAPSLNAPADARNILTVGAVDMNGLIANFSSRGPTADGRLKPEVVARGVYAAIASSRAVDAFGHSNGTSFSCPLVAGCAAVLLSAHPEWTPLQVRQAFMKTASLAATPDNTYGYGIVDLAAALEYLPLNSIVIDHKALPDTTNTTQPYRVLARIRTYRGVNTSQLFVFWRKAGTTTFQPLSMIPLTTIDQYQGLIPPQPKGVTVQYYIQAKDSKNKIGKHPFHAPADLHSFAVH